MLSSHGFISTLKKSLLAQRQIVWWLGEVALNPDFFHCQTMTGSQTWHGPIDLIQMQIFGLPRHGEEKTPASGCQTFKCYFSSSNCLLTHISRCWIQYNQREKYWLETYFCFYTTTHEQHSWHVWPFAHLVVSVAKVFPCNIHDECLAWKQDHRLPRIVEMGQKMPMHVPVLLFILHIWHQRWDEVASDVIIEPPFWAWIKHAKCNRSNDGQIFNINSKKTWISSRLA